ncbi:MAG TPA: hypothetical protein VEC99_03995 [Clostridia bacterium]|nr:hypothetical protein [Clostridia bacterium]
MKKYSLLLFTPPSLLWRAVVGLLLLLVFGCQAADSKPEAYFLKTDSPCYFFADHLTGATYYRFDANGFFEKTAREHMGIIPFGSGTWRQDTNGIVTMVTTNKIPNKVVEEKARPLIYKDKVFLLWPDKSWANDIKPVLDKIDAPEKKLHVYNAFLISEAEYTNAVGKPYPFKYYPHLNPPESK